MPKGLVDIIIVNLNGRHYLEKCLATITSRVFSVSYRVLVVDNGSTDGSQGWLQEYFPDAILIQNKENFGFSMACNQGIQATDGEYVLLLNNDTEFKTDVLAKLVGWIEENPDAGIVGPLIYYPDGTLQPSIKRFAPIWKYILQQLGFVWLLGIKTRLYYPFGPFIKAEYQYPHPVDWLSGACIIFRREMCQNIGLLDEKMPFGIEDMDFAYRARKAGYTNYFIPSAHLVHHKGSTHRTLNSNSERKKFVRESYRKGIARYYRKHHSLLGYISVIIAMKFSKIVQDLRRRL